MTTATATAPAGRADGRRCDLHGDPRGAQADGRRLTTGDECERRGLCQIGVGLRAQDAGDRLQCRRLQALLTRCNRCDLIRNAADGRLCRLLARRRQLVL